MTASTLSTQHSALESSHSTLSTPEDYLKLLKPGVMSLVVFTGAIGMWLAPLPEGQAALHPFLQAIAILAIAIGSGAGGAINMWYDRDIDSIMKRTQNRPIPAGRIEASEALSFGIILAILSVALMGLAANWLAAGLLAFAIFFYAVIYTMGLKRRTPQNIVIGGAAGAFPPMIGWAAMSGSVSLESFLMFLIIFLWTPPHFWALALNRNGDYEKAGVPMLPVTHGARTTKNQILLYSVLLVATTLTLPLLHVAGMVYAVGTSVLGMEFLRRAFAVWRGSHPKADMRLFGYSILYLFALFGLLWLEKPVDKFMHLAFS